MNPEKHEAARCRDGYGCTGTGCRVSTGKTKRKANHSRPKPNQHEGTRITATEGKKKR